MYTPLDASASNQCLSHHVSEAAAFKGKSRRPRELELEMDERKKEIAQERRRKQRSSPVAKEVKYKAKRRHEETLEATQ